LCDLLPPRTAPRCPPRAQLRAEVARLQDAEGRATSSRAELLAAQQEVARLRGQAEAKDRHAAGVEGQLQSLRQQHSEAAAAQAAKQQELDVARADLARLQGQLGAAGRLQGELDRLKTQLADAAQRETLLQQQAAAAEQEARQKAAQVRVGARVCV
jgi:chromosome segregation ATPase